LRGSSSYLDPDLGWHLKVGQEIAQTGAVPVANHFNYTFTGDWVDHEWLSNLIVYEIYNHCGYPSLTVGFALLIILVLILLNRAVYRFRPETSPGQIVFFQLLAVIASLPHFGVRVQELGLLFLLLLFLLLERYNKYKNWKILLLLPPFMYLWACLHASFLIGFFIMAAWLAIKIGEKILVRLRRLDWLDFSRVLAFREMIIFSGAIIFSFIVTLFTPYKLGLYSFLSGYRHTYYQAHIQEWLSQFNFPFQYWQLIYLAIVVFALIFYIYYAAFSGEKKFKVNLWTFFLVVLFVFLSFKSRRHFPLLFVATFLFLIEVYGTIFKTATVDKARLLNGWLKFFLSFCLFLAAFLQLTVVKLTKNPFASYCSNYPCQAIEFLKNNPSYYSRNIFNDYAWGGYLIWSYSERKLFIDGRLPQTIFAGHTFLEEYLDFFKKGEAKEKLEKYQIGLILIPAKEKKIKIRNWEKVIFGIRDEDLATVNNLRDYLLSAADWHPIYYDPTAIIYVKNE
jgi:hypothetical protein